MARPTAEQVYEKSARFAESMVRDLRDSDLPTTIRRDLRETWDFYLDDEERARLSRMGSIRRWFSSTWLLFKNLVLKLTPTRRLILLIGSILALDGVGALGDPGTGNLFLGFIVLLFILGLELKDKLLAKDELAAGRAVQIALMPEEKPSFRGWETWLHTEPANDVGGDLVDYQALDDGRFSVALGDVAGKGLPAALFMAKLQATVRAVAPLCGSLAELGARVNEIFCRDGLPGRFASLAYLETDEGGDEVRVLNAGHQPPIVIRAASNEELDRGAPALGLTESARYLETEVSLAPGDLMVVYSDGVTEARNEVGDFYGDERLRLVLQGAHGRTAGEVGRRIVRSVEDFVGPASPSDDLSIVILRKVPLPALPQPG